MKIVSFAWTSPMLVTGNKFCTRRDWNHRYADSFGGWPEKLQAYDRSPRAHGVQIGVIQLTHKPVWESLSEMTDEDYEAEGFSWALAHPAAFTKTIEGLPAGHFIREVCTREGFERWRNSGQMMWVIRFHLLELTDAGKRLADSCLPLEQMGLSMPQEGLLCH